MPACYQDRILRVLTYIHDNPGGDLSLDQLADVAAMSRFHWHRVFRAMTGETCAQAVRRIRLHRAATWLVQSDLPIDRIAVNCGYPNAASFARAFGEAFGQRPAAFRKTGRLLPPLAQRNSGEYSMHTITIRIEPARRMVGLHHAGSYYKIGACFERFGAMCQVGNLWSQTGPWIGIYFDNPEAVPEENLRSMVGADWHGKDVPQGMKEHRLAGGKTAVLTYKGPYDKVSGAYETLFGEWLPKSGEDPADAPCYEIYLNSPTDTAPEDLLTEICLPLK